MKVGPAFVGGAALRCVCGHVGEAERCPVCGRSRVVVLEAIMARTLTVERWLRP